MARPLHAAHSRLSEGRVELDVARREIEVLDEPGCLGGPVGFGQDTARVEFIDPGQTVGPDYGREADSRNHRDALKYRWVWFGHVMDYSKSLTIPHDDR